MLVEKNIISKTLNNEKLLVPSFFFIYFLIGLYIFRDYGIPFDVEIQKFLAQNRIDYIKIFFSNIFSQTDDEIKNVVIKHPEYGIAFELPALWLEKIFSFTDVRSEYFFRHFLIFLVSFFGSILSNYCNDPPNHSVITTLTIDNMPIGARTPPAQITTSTFLQNQHFWFEHPSQRGIFSR